MKVFCAAVLLAFAIGEGRAAAQTMTTEVDVTLGRSTESVKAAASQVRLFGDIGAAGWVYFAEAAWGDVWGPTSDAFGAAYSYDKRIRATELYVENTFQPGRYIAGVRAGRYRTPFGLSGRSDHGYTGFVRAPLVRYSTIFTLSNNFVEGGVSAIAGTPRLFVEASAGVPQDLDHDTRRRRTLDGVVRVQGTAGNLIVGASHLRSRAAERLGFARGPMQFTGVDVRWMAGGVLLRGEWITGRAFTGTATYGGYVDAIVHRRFMGPVTAVLRAERLGYDAGTRSEYPRRLTAGAKVRLSSMAVGQVNLIVGRGHSRHRRPGSALDLAITLSARHR